MNTRTELLAEADMVDPLLKKFGGGARDLEVRLIEESPIGPFLVVHLIYDVRDAMGANAVNTACEKLAPRIEEITGGRVHLKILSNLADRRLAKASCTIPLKELAFDRVDKLAVCPSPANRYGMGSSPPGLLRPRTRTVLPPTTKAS